MKGEIVRLAFVGILFVCAGCYDTSADSDDEDGSGATSGSGATGGSGASGGSGATGGVIPGCGEERFLLEGTVAGEALSYSGDLDGHAWIQGGDPSTLDTPFAPGGSFHAEWPSVVADGDSVAISGWTQLPPEGTRGGETVNFGTGTMTKYDAGVSFQLSALSLSVVCVTDPCPPETLEGEIHGCVQWTDLSP